MRYLRKLWPTIRMVMGYLYNDEECVSIDDQVALLKERGVEISDDIYAKSILLEIGYYRLGFYLFPFEKIYPSKKQRTHEVVLGTRFGDIVDLYYADMKLRDIFMLRLLA